MDKKLVTVNCEVNVVDVFPKHIQEQIARSPFWNEYDAIIKSASEKYPSVVRNRKDGRTGLGYEANGHVCYVENAFTAMKMWVLGYEDYVQQSKCPVCKEEQQFD